MSVLPRERKRVRLDHDTTKHEVHDEGHSWAVSYADFLMVLLSFFIIFFSIDENQRLDLIDRIAMATTQNGGKNAKGRDRTNETQARLPNGIDSIVSGVDGFFVQRQNNSQKLYIYFDDNIFNPGGIDMPPEQLVKLHEILSRLQPFLSDINVTFVGHTDNKQVSRSKNRYVSDNFDLSSLRATKALQQAVKQGFNPSKMFAKGVAEYSRGSRTLSLVITPGEAE